MDAHQDGGDREQERPDGCRAASRSREGRARVPPAVRPLRGADPPLPPAPNAQPRGGARPGRRDVRTGVARAHAVPRRGRRLGRPVALRDCTARRARVGRARAARADGDDAHRRPRAARPSGRDGRARRLVARGPRRGAGRAAGGPAGRRRAPSRRRPFVRGRRRRTRHLSPRRARPRPSRAANAALTTRRNGGDTVNDLTPELNNLGDALERAAAKDVARAPRRNGRRRRLAIAAVALVIAVPGIAYAAEQLVSNDQVAASMPAGTLALAGTEPTCTVVEQD